MFPHLLPALLLAVTPSVDADLQARFALAALAGIRLEVVAGEPLAPSSFCASEKATCASPERRWDINWRSAPEKVTPLKTTPEMLAGARVLLTSAAGDPLLFARERTLYVAIDPSGATRRWPYFNFLLHVAACDAAGVPAPGFADWEHSPVPHTTARRAYLVGIVVLWGTLLLLFQYARRRGRARPDAAKQFFEAFEAAAGQSRQGSKGRAGATWSKVGFARPLGGLMTTIGTVSFIAGGYLILQWLLSSKVQPFPEADGLWWTTFNSLIVIALLFEFGTNIAAQKYFAQHKVQQPADALADIQFYVWWAFFQRSAQATLLCGAAAFWLPSTEYAIYAPFVALFAIKSLPSIFQLGKLLTGALQRFDYQNLLDLAEQKILVFLMPIPCVLVGREWGLAHPAYGEAFGAAVGLAVGHGLAFLVSLVLGLWALRRLNIPLSALFLVQFDRTVAKRQLVFGGKLAVGAEPVFLIRFIESIVIVKMMQDFTAWHGIHILLTTRLSMLFGFGQVFYGGGIAAFSESFSAGKRNLTQYYIQRYIQFGFLFHATMLSVVLAVGPTFINALGPQWSRALPFLFLGMVGALFQPPVFVSDSLQQGAGRAWTFFLTMIVENGARLGLFFLLVPLFQFAGILASTMLALAIKAIFGWAINHATIIKVRLKLWITFAAPALAAAANYAVWRLVADVWAPTSSVATMALMCIASGISFVITFFVAGLAGSFDARALEELDKAAQMVSMVGPIARGLRQVAELGARLSPLRPAAPAMADAAYAEALELDTVAEASLQAPAAAKPAEPEKAPAAA